MIIIVKHRLKYERKKHGWSQKYISEKTGIPSSNLSRYETGERKPDISTLVVLADFIGCSVDYLLGRSDDPNISLEPSGEDLEDLLLRKQNKLFFRGIPLNQEDIKNLLTILEIIMKNRN